MNNNEIKELVMSNLTDEFQAKKVLLKLLSENGVKPIDTNKVLKDLDKKGKIEIFDDKANRTVFIRLHQDDEISETPTPDKELKRAPEARERVTLQLTEKEAEGLDLLDLRTPPVKEDIKYPEGVTPEMYNEFKDKILEHKSLLWDLLRNFNGCGGTAITMWNPEHEEANKDGKVFYQWSNPMKTWGLMSQLCKLIDLYEGKNKEVATEEE